MRKATWYAVVASDSRGCEAPKAPHGPWSSKKEAEDRMFWHGFKPAQRQWTDSSVVFGAPIEVRDFRQSNEYGHVRAVMVAGPFPTRAAAREAWVDVRLV